MSTAPTLTQIALPFTILFESAKPVLEIDKIGTQLLYGEAFEIEKTDGPFAYGTCKTDDYRGWLPMDCLTPHTWLPTHFIDVLWAPVFPKAGFKNWAMVTLPFLSRIEIDPDKTENGYVYVPSLRGYIHQSQVKPLADIEGPHKDNSVPPLETARRFLETPYQYGGRTSTGIDCSALIQLSLLRSGVKSPRDSNQQEISETLGQSIDFGDPEEPQNLQTGDIVFLEGHVAIMASETEVLNATSRRMSVCIEPLSNFTSDYKDQGLFIKAARRPNI